MKNPEQETPSVHPHHPSVWRQRGAGRGPGKSQVAQVHPPATGTGPLEPTRPCEASSSSVLAGSPHRRWSRDWTPRPASFLRVTWVSTATSRRGEARQRRPDCRKGGSKRSRGKTGRMEAAAASWRPLVRAAARLPAGPRATPQGSHQQSCPFKLAWAASVRCPQ